jgi:hypothetical protein
MEGGAAATGKEVDAKVQIYGVCLPPKQKKSSDTISLVETRLWQVSGRKFGPFLGKPFRRARS